MQNPSPALANPLVHAWWSLARGLWILKTTVLSPSSGGKTRWENRECVMPISRRHERTLNRRTSQNILVVVARIREKKKTEKEDGGYKAVATSDETLYLKITTFDADEVPLLPNPSLQPPRSTFARQNTDWNMV
jgi:hypothetical protein